MKNIINYYYNLYPENIHQTEKGYYFIINQSRYFFTKYLDDPREIKKIYDMHLKLLNHNFYVHPIILNTQTQILTYINNQPYILMLTIHYKNKISLTNLLMFSNIYAISQIKPDWGAMWERKNDYLEYQMSMLGQDHKVLRESFSYYIGLGETAIQLVNSLGKTNDLLVYAHKRINHLDKEFEFYNPLNLTIDLKVRDIAEYFKNSFFNGKNIENELFYYLKNANLTVSEYLFFLARMLYPTYYFDLYEEIITNRQKDENIKKIISQTDNYEKLLKKIYNYYKMFLQIPQIDWLEL